MLKEKAKPCAGLSEKVLNEMYSDGYSPKVWTIMSGPSTTGWQGIVKSILRECILLMRVKPSYGRSKGKTSQRSRQI